jgi:hypothetical protein
LPPFAAVNGTRDLGLSWPAIVWAAISVGRAELPHLFRHGQFSLFEIVYRSALIFANLCDDGSGQIRRSQAYEGLDPSEKSAVSYFLGLTMAKAFAEHLLDTPWLMHLDVYRQVLGLQMVDDSSRPDLVGQTTGGGWVVVESKGRTNQFDPKALARAKVQTQAIGTIAGQVPVLRVGIVTHFGNQQLQFSASDPPGRRRKSIDLPLSQDRLVHDYYRPFRAWLSAEAFPDTSEVGGHSYRTARVEAVDLTVGLAVDLEAADGPGIQQATRPRFVSETAYAGQDGVLVELGPSWTPNNMAREPQERGGQIGQ